MRQWGGNLLTVSQNNIDYLLRLARTLALQTILRRLVSAHVIAAAELNHTRMVLGLTRKPL